MQPGTELHTALAENVLWSLGAHPDGVLTQWKQLYPKRTLEMAPFVPLFVRSYNTHPDLKPLQTPVSVTRAQGRKWAGISRRRNGSVVT